MEKLRLVQTEKPDPEEGAGWVGGEWKLGAGKGSPGEDFVDVRRFGGAAPGLGDQDLSILEFVLEREPIPYVIHGTYWPFSV